MSRFPKSIFVHGRPGPHPAHANYAEQINADFTAEDIYLRWHDKPEASKLRRYLSWVINALLFRGKKKYDVFFAEGVRVPLAIMKSLFVFNKKQKTIILIADEQLYFIKTKHYSNFGEKISKYFLNKSDGFIVVGRMQVDILKDLMRKEIINYNDNIVQIINGVSAERFQKLKTITPNLEASTILFIANGPGGFRIHYKGLDLLLIAFCLAQDRNNALSLVIVGDWSQETQVALLKDVPIQQREKIEFKGKLKNLEDVLKTTSLYVHPARGEAWGISVNEAMTAGVPCIVSEWTGSQEMVSQVENELIFKLDKQEIASKILWYFNLPSEKKEVLSKKSKEISLLYTEEKANALFKKKYLELTDKLSNEH